MFLSCHVHVFRVNPHPIVASMSRNTLLETDAKSEVLNDSNGTRTHNHLVGKWTVNHLAKQTKWLIFVVSTYLYGVFDCVFLSCHVRVCRVNPHCESRDKYSQLNGWVFIYTLSGRSFEFRCCHLKLQIWRLFWAKSSLTVVVINRPFWCSL